MHHIPDTRWAAIKLFAMDVDGILTDGTVHISSDGTETKQFSILDGMGLVRLRKHHIATAWISGRPSGATTVRATELKIPHLVQGRVDKITALQELATTLGLTADQIAYMGDDDIDSPAIHWAGIASPSPTPCPPPSPPPTTSPPAPLAAEPSAKSANISFALRVTPPRLENHRPPRPPATCHPFRDPARRIRH